MTLRCKPGDLCVIVRTRFPELLGRLIRVTKPAPVLARGLHAWFYEGKPLVAKTGFVVHAAEDCCLMPIRDPGADAQDETLAWLPVPTTDEVPV